MPIEITLVKNELVRIVWTTSVKGEGTHNDTMFNLGGSVYYPCIDVSKMLKETATDARSFKVYTELALNSADDLMPYRTKVNGPPTFDSRNQPSAVWVNINRGENKFLTTVGSLTSPWIQNEAAEIQFTSDFPLNFVCEFWIKFSTDSVRFSHSEKKALRQFSELFDKQKNCDIQFCFKDADVEKQIGGHVIILSTRSPVFAAMFENHMEESKTGRVIIEDICPNIFKQILQFIYSGRVCEPLTENTARSLCKAADKYDINDLKEECADFLLSCFRMENALDLMVWAHVYSVKQLEDHALAFVVENFQEICMKDEWEEVNQSYPQLCLLATRKKMLLLEHKSTSS